MANADLRIARFQVHAMYAMFIALSGLLCRRLLETAPRLLFGLPDLCHCDKLSVRRDCFAENGTCTTGDRQAAPKTPAYNKLLQQCPNGVGSAISATIQRCAYWIKHVCWQPILRSSVGTTRMYTVLYRH
jgi:hypothetical protein